MMFDSPARIVAAVTAPAVPAGSCSVPDSPPRITKLVPPVYSEAIRSSHKSGFVDVTVYLESDGSVARAAVTSPPGDQLLEGATYAAAVASTYAPEVKNCTYLAGSYVFRARYKAEPVASNAHPTPAPNVPDEPPPFAPQPQASPAPLNIPRDTDDVLTTYSPSSLMTPIPDHAADRVTGPPPLHPVRALPGATAAPVKAAAAAAAPAVPPPAPVPTPVPAPAASPAPR